MKAPPTESKRISIAAIPRSLLVLMTMAILWKADGANRNWVGGASGSSNDWNTASNWNPSGVPAVTDDATIPNTSAHYPVLSTAAGSCKTLTINSGASFSVIAGGSLATTAGPASVVVNGTLAISGGALSAYQDITGDGSVSMSGGALKVGHDFHLAPANFSATGGTVEWTGEVGSAGPGGFPGGTGSYQFFNILVDPGIDPGFDNQANNFIITGNWINNGSASLTQKSTSVTFHGSSAQTIGGSSPTTFYNLAVNNAAGVLVGAAATVNRTLTLSNGIVTTGASSVNIAAGATVADAGALSYLNGTLQKSFATGNGQSFIFPVGDASHYAPVSLSAINVTSAGSLAACTTAAEHPGITTSGINPAADANRYWTLTKGAGFGVSACSATFNFVAGDVDAGANPASFIVQRYGGAWSTSTLGAATALSTTATALTAFGDFSVGQPGSGTCPACTLVSCTTLSNQGRALSLQGVAGLAYTIQASTDLNSWANIGTATAGTNSFGQFMDADAPNFPIRFYRAVYP